MSNRQQLSSVLARVFWALQDYRDREAREALEKIENLTKVMELSQPKETQDGVEKVRG